MKTIDLGCTEICCTMVPSRGLSWEGWKQQFFRMAPKTKASRGACKPSRKRPRRRTVTTANKSGKKPAAVCVVRKGAKKGHVAKKQSNGKYKLLGKRAKSYESDVETAEAGAYKKRRSTRKTSRAARSSSRKGVRRSASQKRASRRNIRKAIAANRRRSRSGASVRRRLRRVRRARARAYEMLELMDADIADLEVATGEAGAYKKKAAKKGKKKSAAKKGKKKSAAKKGKKRSHKQVAAQKKASKVSAKKPRTAKQLAASKRNLKKARAARK